MTDREALLQMIIENPEDDLPRLIFADWLEETGEPANVARAEFIRLQCKIGSILSTDYSSINRETYARAEEIKKLFEDQWLGTGWVERSCENQDLPEWQWDRGFLFSLRGDPYDLSLPKLRQVFDEHPITELELWGKGQPESVERCQIDLIWDKQAPLESLAFRLLRVEGLNSVLANHVFPQLSSLTIQMSWLTEDEIKNLATSKLIRQLSWLELDDCWLNDVQARYFLSTDSLENHQRLSLPNNFITDSMKHQLRERFGDRVQF